MPRRDKFRWLVFGLVVLATGRLASGLPNPADPQKRVLVLQEFRRDSPLAEVMEDVYRRTLGDALGPGLDYYSEYLDTWRIGEPEYRASVLQYLETRYGQLPLDVVIATTTATLNLVRAPESRMFDGVAVVFHGETGLSGDSRSTGVVSRVDFRRMLDGALRLQPQRKHVAIVSGSAPFDRSYARLARSQLQTLETGVSVSWLAEMPVAEVERRIKALPDDALVFCLSFTQDSTGQRFVTNDVFERLSAEARVPFFGVHEVQVGHGIVGGRVFSSSLVAARTSELALRVLSGESPGDIPAAEIDPYVTRYDWRQLQRWGIAEHSLPAGADVVWREPGAWAAFRPYIIGTLAVVILQAALITGLLAQRASRRKAQGVLRDREAALRVSTDRVRDLAGRLIVAQETERSRIARDLHDDACQEIAGLSVALSRLKQEPVLARDPVLTEALLQIQQRSVSLAENLRLMSHELHPSVLQHVGLMAALESHRLEVKRMYQAALELRMAGDIEPISQDVALTLFRVVQEAVRNACLHGHARLVVVSVGRTENALTLLVSDNGTGFDVDAARVGRGLGLVSIEERVKLLRGQLTVRSARGQGTTIDVAVPDRHHGPSAIRVGQGPIAFHQSR